MLKANLSFSILIGGTCFSVIAALMLLTSAPSVEAQIVRSEEEIRLRERDKSVTDEKLMRVKQESEALQASILAVMKEKFPKFSHFTGNVVGLNSHAIGRRGQAGFSIGWRNGNTRFFLNVSLNFSPEEAIRFKELANNGVTMGDFYKAPEMFGKDAIIVKNLVFNTTVTRVGISFTKGRMTVGGSVDNKSRSAAKNEKDLLEIMEAIYPLLVAKETFEEV
jgi:hypothetical protein